MAKLFRALATRNYRIMFAASFVAHVGTWIHRAAQDWLVVEISQGSAIALGTISALQFLPLPLFGLVAGLLVDRFDKRIVLAAAVSFQLCVSVTIGWLVLTGGITLTRLGILSFLFGVGTAFELPTRQSFVSELVPRESVSNAVSLNSLAFNVGRSIGPVIAGFLIAAVWHHVGPLYLVHAATTIATLASVPLLRKREYVHFAPAPSGSTIRQGIAYVRQRPDLSLVVIVLLFAGLFCLNFQVLIAMLARHDLGIDAGIFGLLSAAIAIGGVAGAATAARMARARLRHLVVSAALFGLLIVAVAGAQTPLVFALLALPLGYLALIVVTSSNALMQVSAPPSMRGRLMSIYVVVIFSSTPLAAPLIGWVGELVGVRWAIAGGGLLLTTVTIVGSVACARRLGTRLWPNRPAGPTAPTPS